MRIEHWWFKLPLRLKSIFRRRRVETELDEELQFHLEHKIQEGLAEGLSPEEARYRALRAMGGLEQKKEEIRDTRGIHWLTDFVDDVRYAVAEPAPHAGTGRLRGGHDRPGDRDDRDALQHARCAGLPAVSGAGPGRRGHAGRHLARQRLRPVLLSRVPRHPRTDEELRRRDRQHAAADRRLQRAARRRRRSRKADCSSPATTSACSTSSRRSDAGSGTTKTRCPAATPWWSFRPTSGSASSRPTPPSSAGPSASTEGTSRSSACCRKSSRGSTSSTAPISTCRSRWHRRSRPTRRRTSSSTGTTASSW